MSDIHELYIVSEGPDGPIKIGRSVSARARICTLQTGNPRPLQLFAIYRMSRDEIIEFEAMLHEELKDRAMVGEWFDVSERFISEYMPDFFLSNGVEAVE